MSSRLSACMKRAHLRIFKITQQEPGWPGYSVPTVLKETWYRNVFSFLVPTWYRSIGSFDNTKTLQLSIFRMECICICCKLWCSSLNGDYRVRLLFFVVVLREAAVAIAMNIVSFVIATLVRYPLQKCSSVSTLTFVSHISKLLL